MARDGPSSRRIFRAATCLHAQRSMTATPMTFNHDACQWLSAATGIAIDALDTRRLIGSTSSSLFAIRSSRDPGICRSVLRVLDNRAWLVDEPDLAAHEAAALAELRRAGLRGPRPIAHLEDETLFGFPVVLMSFVEGTVDLRPSAFDPWLEAIAR